MNVIHIDPTQLPPRSNTTKTPLEHDQLMHVVNDTTLATWLLDE